MKKITFSLHVEYEGKIKDLCELTDEERHKLTESANKRGSTVLSAYYTENPSKFARL